MLNELIKKSLNTYSRFISSLKVKSRRKEKKALLRTAILSGGIRRVK